MAKTLIQSYIRQVEELTEGKPWLDETFHKKLDPITDAQAFNRPLPDIHSVAELVWHLHVWRLSVMARIKGNTGLVDEADNFSDNGRLREIGWASLQKMFYDSQRQLLDLLAGLSDEDLSRQGPDGTTFEGYLEGLIHHDCYHMGQLGLVIKMLKAASA